MSKQSSESNIIYVGRKPPMNYVLAIVTAFSESDRKRGYGEGKRTIYNNSC